MKASNMLSAEESDHELVVNVLANLYDTAKCYIPPVSPNKKISVESHPIRSPTPSSGSDSSMEDVKSQRKKRPLSQVLSEEERIEEERKEKRREKDRIRKRIQREKQRKEKQMHLQAKNNARNDSVKTTSEPLVMPSLQSFFSAYIVPSAEGDSYGILFPLPKPPAMNMESLSKIPEPAVDTRPLKLPQFTPFFVNNRVMG